LGALALTEPGAGSDLVGGVRTRAELEGDDWVINGSKAWITNGGVASIIVTLCRADPAGGSRSLSLPELARGASRYPWPAHPPS